jgi:ubiquinone/menaquinone biosynthesis C-methylase UbiE
MAREVRLGMGQGAVYPASQAKMLLHPFRRFLHSSTRLAAAIGLEGGMTVLELGPGPGYFSIEFLKRLPRGRLVLFDIQAEMLAMARERLIAAGEQRHSQVQGDALTLPFRDGAFDMAILVEMLGEVPTPPACVAEVARTLKPGGSLVVSEARGDPDRIRPRDLAAMAAAAGLVPIGKRPGRGWTYTARFQKPA